jgi:hypothetical protein
MRPISEHLTKKKMNKMEITNHGRGLALTMGLASIQCVYSAGIC